jgi:hypothetical protein
MAILKKNFCIIIPHEPVCDWLFLLIHCVKTDLFLQKKIIRQQQKLNIT